MNFSYLLAAFGVIEQNLPMVKEQIGDSYGLVFMGVGVVVAVLRKVTTQPLNEK